jgi:hypothetical protein
MKITINTAHNRGRWQNIIHYFVWLAGRRSDCELHIIEPKKVEASA